MQEPSNFWANWWIVSYADFARRQTHLGLGAGSGFRTHRDSTTMDDQFTFDDDPRLISIRKKFEAVKARLRKQMPTQPFERFILPLRVKELDGNVVVLAAPGRFIQTWVSDKYQAVLSSHLSAECGERMEVQVESVLNLRTEAVEEPAAIAPPISDSASERYTFENFVAGQNNQLAFNGARQVASNPGGLCNPLFVYGKTGLGKTHLLCA